MAARKRPATRRTRRRTDTTAPSPQQTLLASIALGVVPLSVVVIGFIGWVIPWFVWPLFLVIITVLLILGSDIGRFLRAKREYALRTRSELLVEWEQVLGQSGTRFEVWMQRFLQATQGWTRLEHRGGPGDGCMDVVGYNAHGEWCIVQCKRYAPRHTVAAEDMYKLYGAVAKDHFDRGYLVTTSKVSAHGHAWAANLPLEIWEGEHLQRLLAAHRRLCEAGVPFPYPFAQWLVVRYHRWLGIAAASCLMVSLVTPLITDWRSAPPPVPTGLLLQAGATVPALPLPSTSPPQPIRVPVMLPADTLLYRTPDEQAPVIGTVPTGSIITVVGRNAHGDWQWVHVQPETYGWMRAMHTGLTPDQRALLAVQP